MTIHFPLPSDEAERLEALKSLRILDTPPAPAFDAVVAIATAVLNCPIGLVSIVDVDRQWFKAGTGLGLAETPRDVAFCNYTILGPDALVVEDARSDARFQDNPLVTSSPGIRFYAGVPIEVEGGRRIGSLCVIDTKPRRLDRADLAVLRRLGRIVEELIDGHVNGLRATDEALRAADLASMAEDWRMDLTNKTKLLSQSESLAKVGLWRVDLASGEVRWSDEVYRIHDLHVGSPVTLESALAFYLPEDLEIVAKLVDDLIATGKTYEFEQEIETAKGKRRWLRAVGDREMRDGVAVGIFGIVQDVTERRKEDARLWQAANFDALTAIPNRFHWNAKLAEVLGRAAATGASITILLLDLDGFKEINDTLGHAVGDEVLRIVAERLGAVAPPGCLTARMGGDEFALLLEGDQTSISLEAVAKQVAAKVFESVAAQGATVRVTGTLGGATFPRDADSAIGLMKAADIALYQAKRSRRGSIVIFHKAMAGLFDEKCRSVGLVHTALAERRLVPFYQPKVELRTGRVVGFEALARILSADGTVLGPSHFDAALRDPATTVLIGSRMLELVTRDIAGWRRRGMPHIPVAINMAEADFTSGGLPNRLASRLSELDLPASSLEIEITEDVVIGKEADAITRALHAIRASGVALALDDFGTGFASLSHLRDLPLDYIKIDRSFVAGLGGDSDSEIIVRSVVDLGHRLGKTIIAEGIETRQQADLLRSIGCEIGQGFLFGHPLSVDATEEWLRRTEAASRIDHTEARPTIFAS